MFEHLLKDYEPAVEGNPLAAFVPLERATPMDLLDGQVNVSDWLEELGAPDIDKVVSIEAARDAQKAFLAVTAQQTPEQQKQALTKLRVPAAVRKTVAMLTEYDWAFVEQAKELRGYTVAKIFDMTQHPDPRHALRALEMLGKVSEVGLFTERMEITKIDMTDEALEAKIKAKLDRFRSVIDVNDVIETTTSAIPPNPKWAEELVYNDPKDTKNAADKPDPEGA